jgi:hypothetical protein
VPSLLEYCPAMKGAVFPLIVLGVLAALFMVMLIPAIISIMINLQ